MNFQFQTIILHHSVYTLSNAESFKQWLAQVGSERLDEISDPEIAIERAVATYREKGFSEK